MGPSNTCPRKETSDPSSSCPFKAGTGDIKNSTKTDDASCPTGSNVNDSPTANTSNTANDESFCVPNKNHNKLARLGGEGKSEKACAKSGEDRGAREIA